MAMQIRRRPAAAAADWGADLHPVLRRVYAARGVAQPSRCFGRVCYHYDTDS